MVQFTTIVAMVGMPMLVMASPLADTSSALPLAQRTVQTGHDNENGAWFAGGFREAIKTIDGTGIEKDNLFSSIGSKDAKQVAEVGKWAFKYLTGMDGVLEPVSKDTTRWDRWMSSIGQDPMIILTNDAPPAKGLKPNQYYTIHSSTDNGKSHIMLWSTTVKTMQDSFVEVDSEGLKASTRNLYHLANWPAY
ncbi:hypothetical protein L204_104702 [Cryptococcus depauperatus]